MCYVLLGDPGCVTGGGGSKLAKNSVTYFMDGPLLLCPEGQASYYVVRTQKRTLKSDKIEALNAECRGKASGRVKRFHVCYQQGCSDPFKKNLKSGNFRFFIFQVKIFTFFKSKSVNLFEFIY